MDDPTNWSAAAMAQRVAAGDISCRELTAAHIARMQAADPRLHFLAVPRFDEALAEAQSLDDARARGEPLGPLAGVPVTIKECFHVRGLPTTLGLTARKHDRDAEDATVVTWMRQAGAIVLAKTNVPQLMLFMETDNPLYGRTDNPWNPARTPGGSSGGDAAAVAAGGAALGLGSDVGGSIRVPAHFTGIFGFKPTAHSLPMTGSDTSLSGFEAINTQPGPLARHAEALTLWWQAMRAAATGASLPQRPRASSDVSMSLVGRRFACWEEDEVYPASPAVRRAVREAAAALEARGMVRAAECPPGISESFHLYIALCTAQGAGPWRRMLAGSEADRRMLRLCTLAGLWSWVRPLAARVMEFQGEARLARMVRMAGPRSAEEYCGLIDELSQLRQRAAAWLAEERLDLLLCPAFATAAVRHGDAPDLLPAAASTLWINLLGLPSGAAPVTRVRADEQQTRPDAQDTTDRKAVAADAESAGLPVGVQLAAPWWGDDLLLAALGALEDSFAARDDYPRTPVTSVP